jgi:ABC-type lipoprotein release transport system permease subunit
LYPSLPARDYPLIAVLVIVSALVASVYPGIRAVRLSPVAAIRTY